jgi:acyl-CoA synthetase (AMP-forming)/AMP-acid ligase II
MKEAIRKEVHYGQRIFDCYAERPNNIGAMFASAVNRNGTAIALQDGARTLGYRELDAITNTLSASLRSLGVGRGDRVALILDNRFEFIFTILACAKLGAIAVPMGTRLRRPEIEFICRDSGAKVLVHEASIAEFIPDRATLPELQHRFAVSDESSNAGSFADLLARPSRIDAIDVDEDAPICIMYTSGTTGKPKGAIITHLGLVHSCLHWVHRLGLQQGISTALAIPASHIAGLAGVVLPILSVAGRIILVRNFKAATLLQLMSSERIEHALLVPTMYNLCLLDPTFGASDLSSWRWGVYGGAPMPPATIRRFSELLPDLQMCNAYGATETTSPATIMFPGRGMERSDSIGHSVACGDIRIMDGHGREVARGETGELYIAGPMVVPGYWRNDEANRTSFVCGYWRSGDIGSIDEEGFVQIFDRKKDMIIRGGYKIYPAEVENVLIDHPSIIEAAVIGRADEVLGERVVAFVQKDDGPLTSDEVRSFCREHLADYKIPDHIEFSNLPLPRNANGKLQKDVLRARLKA